MNFLLSIVIKILLFVRYCSFEDIVYPIKFNDGIESRNVFADKGEVFSTIYKRSLIILILNEHNKYRSLHRVEELELDDKLTYEAEQWAEHVVRYGSDAQQSYLPFGKNIWLKNAKKIQNFMNSDSLNPVKLWYTQIKDYPGYINHSTFKKTNAFTQVVWRSTRKLGVGVAYSFLRFCVVCYYYPPGNAKSRTEPFTLHADEKFQANVFPPFNDSWIAKIPISYEPDITILLFLFGMMLAGIAIYTNYEAFSRLTTEEEEEEEET